MLTARNATVTTCHTHTRDLAAECRAADIVVAAVGRARTIGVDAVREDQTIIDVGITGMRTLASWSGTSILMLWSRLLVPSPPCRAAWAP